MPCPDHGLGAGRPCRVAELALDDGTVDVAHDVDERRWRFVKPAPRSRAERPEPQRGRSSCRGEPGCGHTSQVARILVGVTGGIAAYKACELVRLLVRAGHDVTPIVTAGAERFVAAETFWALARKEPPENPYPHLQDADLLVVAPLTANTMARLAHGLADDLLTETALAHRGALLLAPAMNTSMWEHPATQANLDMLVSRGASVVGPEHGELAEGLVGTGRMSEPEAIAQRVEELVRRADPDGPLAGKRVLVTAGGTREPLDATAHPAGWVSRSRRRRRAAALP